MQMHVNELKILQSKKEKEKKAIVTRIN